MLQRTQTYWWLTGLLTITGLYAFWLFFQWYGLGSEPGADLAMSRRNAFLSLFASILCIAGVVALTIAHFRKMRRDI
ncbi:MAG: hypothetical protein OEU86_02795 [Gammaproteobacteria bacterium]|nr:hypothetical protein [Gammaproteobacteria bacterium]